MRKLTLLAAALLMTALSFAQTKWTVDPMHSSINFEIRHLGIALVNGHFDKYSGSISNSKEDLSDAQINFTVATASVNTKVEGRDKHLQSDDFLNAEKYPEMKFTSTSFKKVKGSEYALAGNLTIRDVTKPVVFKVTYGGTAKDNYGNTKAGFHATTVINRTDYNVNYDPTGKDVAKEVAITLNLEFAQDK